MAESNSNSSTQTQFRKGFLSLLETLRFSVVLLHNKLSAQQVPAKGAKTNDQPNVLPELTEGAQNYISRIEHLKHDVAYLSTIRVQDMVTFTKRFEELKSDILTTLQSKVTNPAAFFSSTNNTAVKNSIDQIKQHWIELDENKLEIHTPVIPEEVNANKLSSGTRVNNAKRF